MKPVTFPEVNKTYAKDQKEYIPLPGHKVDDPKGEFIFCMQMSFTERLRLLITGKLWCCLLTFNGPLTPSYFSTKKSDLFQNDLSWSNLSWFGRLNYYFLQFLFVRLTKHQEEDGSIYWSIQYWIKPRTGWINDFIFLGKPFGRFFRLTKTYKAIMNVDHPL